MLIDNLNKIRSYTRMHRELMKSHHFLYNCPLGKVSDKAEAIVIGMNPGETKDDWKYNKNLPCEESHEFDFHDELDKQGDNRSQSSINWERTCNEYLGTDEIFLSEFFFWSSSQVGEDKKKGETFKDRFGNTFKNSQHHLHFCKEQNLDLIKYHQPKIIVGTGTTHADFLGQIYNLNHIKTIEDKYGSKRRRVIIHFELMNIPFLFTPHWTAGRVSNSEKSKIKEYIKNIT